MPRFRDIPIKRKLTLGILLTGGCALLLACGAFVTHDLIRFRETMVRNLTSLADVLSVNSTAALQFEAPSSAEETLAGLKAQPHITTACFYDGHGRVFATYARSGTKAEVPARVGEIGAQFEPNRLVLFQPVTLDNKPLGTIYLQADLEQYNARIRLYAKVVILVLLSALFVLFALSAGLQQVISKPILALARTAKLVSERKDYALRAEKFGHDELGQLTDAFNEMLAQIQQREAALRKVHEELELRVHERTAELARANAALRAEVVERKRVEEQIQQKSLELERSNKELEQFAYIASHDLQEPLRMVSSYLQLLQQRLAGKLDADATDFMGYVTEGADRMRALIRDLLEYSRVGRKAKQVAAVDTATVLGNVLTNLEPTIKETEARITHGPLPTITADETELTQLFQNLIGNALKFHGRHPPKVRIEAAHNNAEWVFSVRDNGIGIDPQYADRVFVVFQRLHNRDKYPGTGIGLAICKKIVERHGGRIWVESQADEGATFYFSIPDHPVGQT